jgi:hypothetical protein
LGGGRFVPDFVILRADGDYHLVEIESPRREIFQSAGQEISAHFNHALTQVKDWLRYIGDNRDTVRREDGLATIYEPTGEVIAGRDSQLGEVARRRFEFERAEQRRIVLRTYDMVLRDARAYAETLKRMKRMG